MCPLSEGINHRAYGVDSLIEFADDDGRTLGTIALTSDELRRHG
jgi:hypothetical protein